MSSLTRVVDLAAERLGGKVLLANDEFFAPKENLLKPGRGEFIEEKYTDRGKWMDGWETRRRREPGHDWCIVALGAPGVIRTIIVDTNHFKGNYPEACSIDACTLAGELTNEELKALGDRWVEIVPRTPLQGDNENSCSVRDARQYSHVRLNIYPDGGVARLRVLGDVVPDWNRIASSGKPIDLVAVSNGGVPLACSDEFFSEPLNLIMPGRAATMGDGWETRRRRGPGHDWVILRLGCRGVVQKIEVDTNHFKGNYPESCSIEGCDAPGSELPDLTETGAPWQNLLPRTKLQAHTQHVFETELVDHRPVTHVRFNIFPDGGVSRLRLFGLPSS